MYTGRPMRVAKTAFIHDWETNRKDEMAKALKAGVVPVPYLNEAAGVDPLPDGRACGVVAGWPCALRCVCSVWVYGRPERVRSAAALQVLRCQCRSRALCVPVVVVTSSYCTRLNRTAVMGRSETSGVHVCRHLVSMCADIGCPCVQTSGVHVCRHQVSMCADIWCPCVQTSGVHMCRQTSE
jgi:hypothetical protein